VKRRISFHIERSEIFHNFRKKIISHSATPNISLNSRVAILFGSLSIVGVKKDKKFRGKKHYPFTIAPFLAPFGLEPATLEEHVEFVELL